MPAKPSMKTKEPHPYFFVGSPEVLLFASVLKQLGITRFDRDVLDVILYHARRTNQATMSDGTIARIMDKSRKAISEAVGRLEDAGLIRRVKVRKTRENATGRAVIILFWIDPGILPKIPDQDEAPTPLNVVSGDDVEGPECQNVCEAAVSLTVTPASHSTVTPASHNPDSNQTVPDAPFASLRSWVPSCGSQGAAYRPRRWAADLEQKAAFDADGRLAVEGRDDAEIEQAFKAVNKIGVDLTENDVLAVGDLLARIDLAKLVDAAKEAVRCKKWITGDPLDYFGRIARTNHETGSLSAERRKGHIARAIEQDIEDGLGTPPPDCPID